MFLKLFIIVYFHKLITSQVLQFHSFSTWNIHFAPVYPFCYKNDWKERILSCRARENVNGRYSIYIAPSIPLFVRGLPFRCNYFFSRMYLGLYVGHRPTWRYSVLFHHPRVHCPSSFLFSLSKYQSTSSMDRVFAFRLHCRLYCISNPHPLYHILYSQGKQGR